MPVDLCCRPRIESIRFVRLIRLPCTRPPFGFQEISCFLTPRQALFAKFRKQLEEEEDEQADLDGDLDEGDGEGEVEENEENDNDDMEAAEDDDGHLGLATVDDSLGVAGDTQPDEEEEYGDAYVLPMDGHDDVDCGEGAEGDTGGFGSPLLEPFQSDKRRDDLELLPVSPCVCVPVLICKFVSSGPFCQRHMMAIT
jgi:hypothetical protein